MSTRIHYTQCPVCGSAGLKDIFGVKDFTVSSEVFNIVECTNCTLRFTQDVPDRETIAPYYRSEDYISHTNTKKGLINSLYHAVRKRTIVQKRKLIARVTGLGRGRLLDVGSGVGLFVKEMVEHGWEAKGLEPDAAARAVAKQQYGTILDDIAEFDQLPKAYFNAITLWHVLEHVHDLHSYIGQLKNSLTSTGRLIIAVPNYTSYDAQTYAAAWAAYDTPRHLYHFSPASMVELMKRNGLQVQQYRPMWYDSFYVSLLSSKYKNGKINWISAIFNGLVSNIKAIGDPRKCSSVIYIISK
jgi:2-polyprenyl-3-methyl-5-hydroxy-6-metoxy-1,4-benzoquinol methylase